MNYFQFFNVPESFRPDEGELRRIFLKNSKRFHPDFHSNESDERQAELLELSSRNNEAFQILGDPARRMRHLLETRGLLENGGKNLPLPPAFLMEMMEINEGIDELDGASGVSGTAFFREKLASIKAGLEKEIDPILEGWSPETDRPGQLEAVRDFFLKSRYLLRAEEKLDSFAGLSDGEDPL